MPRQLPHCDAARASSRSTANAALSSIVVRNPRDLYMYRSVLSLIAAVVITACATPPEKPVIYRPATKEGRVLDFRVGGAPWNDTVRYVVDGAEAWKEIGKPRGLRGGGYDHPIRQQVRAVPSSQQWQTFWKEVDQLGIHRWKREYTQKSIDVAIYDGTRWRLTVTTHAAVLTSKGDNVYPQVGRPDVTTTDDAAFKRLENAFEALLVR